VIWKPEAGGKLRPVAVRTGITDYTFTQLIAGEVKSGDLLATGEQSGGNESGNGAASTPKFGAPR
jgi:hypothetical protein